MLKLEEILAEAKQHNASDIHLKEGCQPRIRAGGELSYLQTERVVERELLDRLYSYMTVRQKKELEENGEENFSYRIGTDCLRIHLYKQAKGYAATIRPFGNQIPTGEELKLPKAVWELLKRKKGFLFVTGPTGSGKTTTIASMLEYINQQEHVHIVTLEKPIEYWLEEKQAMITQREIGRDCISYQAGIYNALKQDADILYIDEIPDYQTAKSALSAAEEGKLVISSMHTVGLIKTIQHLTDMFPENERKQFREELSSVLEGVISQQLIPSIVETKREPAYEAVVLNREIKAMIKEQKIRQLEEFLQNETQIGIQCMDQSIYQLYLEGIIDRERALLYAQNIAVLEKKLI